MSFIHISIISFTPLMLYVLYLRLSWEIAVCKIAIDTAIDTAIDAAIPDEKFRRRKPYHFKKAGQL